jgi:hypothetical protein
MLKTEDRFAPRHKKQDLNPEFGAEAQGEESRRGRRRSQTPEQVVRIEEAKAECGRDAWLCRFADRVKGYAPRDSCGEGCGPTRSGGRERRSRRERDHRQDAGGTIRRARPGRSTREEGGVHMAMGRQWLAGQGKSRGVFRRKARVGKAGEQAVTVG